MRWWVGLTLVVMAAECGGEGSPRLESDASGTWDRTLDRVNERSSGDERTTPDEQESIPEEDFIAAFVYKRIIAGENDTESDLYLVDPHGRNPLNPAVAKPVGLSTFALDANDCELVTAKDEDGTPLTKESCSCLLGCQVDKTLTWILVTVEKPDQNGFAFQVGKFNANLRIEMVKGVVFKNIAHAQFAGNYLLFSKVVSLEPKRQFQVFRVDLNHISNPEFIFMLPPDEDPDFKDGQTVTTGHFVASDDGQTVSFLSPTIRSSRVYVWRGGALRKLDYLCPGGKQGGHCVGTGSEFSDIDPLTLSPDGSKLAWFPTTRDGLEVRLYNTDSSFLSRMLLLDTSGKDFKAESCAQIRVNDWKFAKVSCPMFSPDGKNILFIASSHCDPSEKPFTDILSLPVAVINSGVFGPQGFSNLTMNPRTNTPENSVIQFFDLSPEGRNIVFVGSPSFGEDKETPLPATSGKAKSGAELWVLPLDGGKRRQITYNPKYSVTWVRALPPL